MSLILTAYAQVIYMLNVINKSVVPPSLQFGHRLWGRGRWSADEGVGGAVPPAGHRNHRGDQDYEHIRQAGHLRKDRVARLGICAGLSLEPYVGLLKAFSEWNFSWKWQSVCYLCSDIDILLPKHYQNTKWTLNTDKHQFTFLTNKKTLRFKGYANADLRNSGI